MPETLNRRKGAKMTSRAISHLKLLQDAQTADAMLEHDHQD